MPNWKITDNLKWEVKREVTRLMELRVKAVYQDFPLSHNDIERATTPEWARRNLAELKKAGAESITRTDRINARLSGEGITRAALVGMHSDKQLYYMYEAQAHWRYARDEFKKHDTGKLPFDLSVLDPETRAKLVTWVNTAVRERRICSGTENLAGVFLSSYCPTLAHMNARWPDLKVVFGKLDGNWPQRIRNLPMRELSRWQWPEQYNSERDWFESNKLRLEAAGQVLAGALFLDRKVEYPKTSTSGIIDSWEG
jgi:hypothetical protein